MKHFAFRNESYWDLWKLPLAIPRVTAGVSFSQTNSTHCAGRKVNVSVILPIAGDVPI